MDQVLELAMTLVIILAVIVIYFMNRRLTSVERKLGAAIDAIGFYSMRCNWCCCQYHGTEACKCEPGPNGEKIRNHFSDDETLNGWERADAAWDVVFNRTGL